MRDFQHDGAIQAGLQRRRDELELVQLRAQHLPSNDAAFIRALYVDGLSASKLARLQGTDPRAIRRRARRILRRMNSPLFIYVVREMHNWSRARRATAEASVLAGRGVRAAALETGLSLHVVRRHLEVIRAMSEARPTPAVWRDPSTRQPEVRP